jgi:hypothetical protein
LYERFEDLQQVFLLDRYTLSPAAPDGSRTTKGEITMSRLKGYLLTASGFTALVAGLMLTSPPAGEVVAQKIDDVRVVNLSSQPVPTAAQGTTAISGAVSISNIPTVNLGTGNTVQLAYTPNNPLPVRDADPARQPFQNWASDTQADGTNGSTITIATVPAGKRLVIEFLSAVAQMPAGQHLVVCQINTIAPPFGGLTHELLINQQPAFVNGDALFRASQQVRLYADPGSQVRALMTRDSSQGQALFLATLSGYLVDVP